MAFAIGIDFDDVLVGTANEVIRIHNLRYGTQLVQDDWYDNPPNPEPWNVQDFKQVVERVIAIQNEADFINKVRPLEGARDALIKLKTAGHSLFVVTGRPLINKEATIRVLGRLYGDIIAESDLYFTDHYGHEGPRADKADIALQLKLTHFIDDVVEHANGVAAQGVKTLLFSDNYIWNQKGAASGVVRVSSWREIGEFFDRESAA